MQARGEGRHGAAVVEVQLGPVRIEKVDQLRYQSIDKVNGIVVFRSPGQNGFIGI